jgi:CRP-like cAMP-binding protein
MVLDQLGPGLFFGEMALLDDRPRTATIVALEDTTCLTLWSGHFRVQLESHPEMALALLPELARRWRNSLARLAALC